MSKHIVILGSINYDITASTQRLPSKGETVSGYAVDMFGGGKGANQAVQSALLGVPTTLIGQVGNDTQGNAVLASLKAKGVNCQHITISDTNRTGCASIYIDAQGDNMLVYAPGANHYITTAQINASQDAIANADVFITQTEINMDAIKYGLQLAHQNNAITILNPAPALPLDDDIFPLLDYITPNETESEVYTNILRSDIPIDEWKKRNADWFLNRNVKNVCITMGEKGVFLANEKGFFDVPAFSIKAVDTTAAGDSFHGGFAYGLANDYEMETCLKIGSACGALAAMGLGAQNSIQPLEKVTDFLHQQGISI